MSRWIRFECFKEEIPNIICYGILDLSNNYIKEIPKGFIQNGTLYLSSNLIEGSKLFLDVVDDNFIIKDVTVH